MEASDLRQREEIVMHLCLHFDINKTIIMSDFSCGRSIEETFNSLLSECSWGFINQAKTLQTQLKASDWKIFSTCPSSTCPISGAVTFGTFLEDLTTLTKTEQNKLKRTFTNPGCVGEQLQTYCLEITNNLKMLPAEIEKAAALNLEYFRTGYYHIIPSFYRLIEFLAERGIEFSIVFRTFGSDIANVCHEFNIFCSGQHPAYIPSLLLDGTDKKYHKDLRIRLPDYHGKILRTSNDSQGVHLAHVTKNKTVEITTGASKVYNVIMTDWLGIYTNDDCNSDNNSRGNENNGTNNDKCSSHRYTYCAAIQDDYHWWRDHHESEESGKLFLVDRNRHTIMPSDTNTNNTTTVATDITTTAIETAATTTNKNSDNVNIVKQSAPTTTAAENIEVTDNNKSTVFLKEKLNNEQLRVIQIFFDDNIERNRSHIVDVRDRNSFEPISFQEAAAEKQYIHRVEPYDAIMNKEYYVEQVREILSRQYGYTL